MFVVELRILMDNLYLSEKCNETLTNFKPAFLLTSSASDEQHQGATQVTMAIHGLDTMGQSNAASSEEIAATSEELSGQAQTLQEAIGFFKTS